MCCSCLITLLHLTFWDLMGFSIPGWLSSMQGQVIQAQNSLKQKEKEEQQLQSNINELKQLTEQKKKQIETLQGEVKIAVSQKVI